MCCRPVSGRCSPGDLVFYSRHFCCLNVLDCSQTSWGQAPSYYSCSLGLFHSAVGSPRTQRSHLDWLQQRCAPILIGESFVHILLGYPLVVISCYIPLPFDIAIFDSHMFPAISSINGGFSVKIIIYHRHIPHEFSISKIFPYDSRMSPRIFSISGGVFIYSPLFTILQCISMGKSSYPPLERHGLYISP